MRLNLHDNEIEIPSDDKELVEYLYTVQGCLMLIRSNRGLSFQYFEDLLLLSEEIGKITKKIIEDHRG